MVRPIPLFFLAAVLHLSAANPAECDELPPNFAELSFEDLKQIPILHASSVFPLRRDVAGVTAAAIGRSDWERRGERTVGDAIGHLPAVSVMPGRFGGYAISFRGYSNAVSARGISVLLDGVPINDLKYGSSMFDLPAFQLGVLDEIEVVPGPGSPVHGADAFHGVLSLETFEASRDTRHSDIAVGSDGYHQLAGRFSERLSEDLRINSALAYSGAPDQGVDYSYRDPELGSLSQGERQNRYGSYTGVFKAAYQDTLNAGVYVIGHNQEDFPGAGRFLSTAGVSNLADRDLAQSDTRFLMGNISGEFPLDRSINLQLRTFAWRNAADRRVDQSRAFGRISEFDELQYRRGATLFLTRTGQGLFSHLAVGYEYSHQEIARSIARFVDPRTGELLAGGGKEAVDGYVRENNALIIDGRMHSGSDRLQLLYGARLDLYSDVDDYVAPRAGAIYTVSDSSKIRLLYGNSFRALTAGEAVGSSTISPAGGEPERMNSYELGYQWSGKNWEAEFVAFHSEWDDAITVARNPAPPPLLLTANDGANQSSGVSFDANISQGAWRGELNFSYVRSEDEIKHRDFTAFPPWIVNFGTGYTFPGEQLSIHWINRLQLDLSEGPITDAIPSPRPLKDYWRSDLTLAWRPFSDRHEFHLDLLNVFDRENFHPSLFNAERGIPDIGVAAIVGFRGRFS